MADQGSSDSDKISSLGRGRGRGVGYADPEARATSSSTSEKRPGNGDANGNGKNNANGNGVKRGMSRDQRHLARYHITKPEHIVQKTGTSGQTRMFSANYFRMVLKKNFEFVLYRVDFEPEIENIYMRKAFIGSQRELLGGYIFDGANMIYTTHRLEQDVNNFPIKSRENVDYVMTIKNTNQTITMTDDMAMQVLNLILRRTMEGLNMQLVGRNLYDPKNKVPLPDYKMELWPGYVTSIRQHENDILVCCEVSHKVMRKETIYDILRRCQTDSRGRDYKDDFKRELIGATVLTDYNTGGNSKTYRIDDIDFTSSPNSTFDMKGTPTSYADYYKTRYNLQIQDKNQPMLMSNPSARDARAGRTQILYLVPELCRATGLTDKMRQDFRMMKAMAEHTQMDPENRKKRLLDLSRRWHSTKECTQQLNAFNTDIEKQLVQFTGRALPQEEILLGRDRRSQNDDRVDWTNALKSNAMYTSMKLERWLVLVPRNCRREIDEFLKLMEEVSNGLQFEMSKPKIIELENDRNNSYTNEIQAFAGKDPKLIMIVVPNNAADRYAAIKKATCVTHSIPTQVIVKKTMMPKQGNMSGVKSIATKVMIQINAKLGGAPWMIKFPMSGVMTIGFDTTHDTSDRSKSFGAFVASLDLKQDVSYFSTVSAHKDGDEMSQNIGNHLVEALKAWQSKYQCLPERIFFYRDGVGDGDINRVHTTEVQRLVQKLNDIYAKNGNGKAPKFSFIIVNKRINTRIFENGGGKVKNPVSGTVIDQVITLPERYDFFLVSQSVRQGTVSPTSYNVIYDSNGLSPDKMQMLTYKQTHLYYNWSGTTRVPAVVQYSHKLAFLVGQYLHQAPSKGKGFENKLYFL